MLMCRASSIVLYQLTLHWTGKLSCIVKCNYLPNKKVDKLGLTRSPRTEFLGFCSKRGPESPIIRAPTGAVKRMASTATLSTFMPYFCSCTSFLALAISKAVEPIAACLGKETKNCSPFKVLNEHSQKDGLNSCPIPALWLWASMLGL